MSWKDVRTANPDKSIWRDLPEDTFRRHLVALEERTNAVPIDPRVLDIKAWRSSKSSTSIESYILPIEVEQEIADDFACLAAVEEGAQSVAAVCIEQDLHTPTLNLRFAALDTSLDESVKGALHDISTLLSNIASRAIADQKSDNADLIDALFDRVIRLHFRRLLARLRSTKWEKPKHLSKSHKKALWQDFPNLSHRAQFLYLKKEKARRREVEDAVQDLATKYETFEDIPAGHDDEQTALKNLVTASLSFCTNSTVRDYALRLENSIGGTPTKQVSSAIKCLRQIEKIAAYKRICISLAARATEFASAFVSGLTLAYLSPYKSVPTSVGYEEWARTCHVHAEVQLAVHYDLEAQSGEQTYLPPRTIGISKWLCYLCYRFLQAHGGFFASKTHGRLYDQWTVPDLVEFDEVTCKRYREIVGCIDRDVTVQIEQEPELWRIEPMTSRQDLLINYAPTESTEMCAAINSLDLES